MPFVNRIALLCVLFLLIPITVLAGNLDDPGAPTTAGGGAMNTLEDIYNLINSGTTNAPRTGTFTEPSAGPASTSHTLTQIYERAKTSSRPARTGQTTCYDSSGTEISCTGTGQDGDELRGVAWPASPNLRFTDNGNGTVTDNLTGLIWLKNANCDGLKSWANALSFCNSLHSGQCGLSDGSAAGDWRLPNRFELESLLDLEFYGPALSNAAGTGQWSEGDAFTGVQSLYYWTSTTFAKEPDKAWILTLAGERSYRDSKADADYVWPVRGGQAND